MNLMVALEDQQTDNTITYGFICQNQVQSMKTCNERLGFSFRLSFGAGANCRDTFCMWVLSCHCKADFFFSSIVCVRMHSFKWFCISTHFPNHYGWLLLFLTMVWVEWHQQDWALFSDLRTENSEWICDHPLTHTLTPVINTRETCFA